MNCQSLLRILFAVVSILQKCQKQCSVCAQTSPSLSPAPLATSVSSTAGYAPTAAGSFRTPITVAVAPPCDDVLPRATRTNYSLYPTWYVDTVLLPYDRISYCVKPNLYIFILVGSNVSGPKRQYFATDFRTKEVLTSAPGFCAAYPAYAWLSFLSDFYETFYGFPPIIPPAAKTDPPTLFYQLVLLATPLSCATLIGSLVIIRRLLKQYSATHMFYYHIVIVVVDVVLYVVNAIDGARLFGIFLVPVCYSMHAVAVSSFVNYATDAALCCNIALYCTSAGVQALLAIDRYYAVLRPVKYHNIARPVLVAKCVTAVIGANVGLAAVNFFTTPYMARSISAGTPGLTVDALTIADQVIVVVRIAFLFLCLATQLFACCRVFFRLRTLTHSSQHTAISSNCLAPCYLLFGTCVLSFIGTAFICVYLIFTTLIAFVPTNPIITVGLRYAGYGVKITTPICSGLGFYVHCAASGQYRRLLMKTRVARWFSERIFNRSTKTKVRHVGLNHIHPEPKPRSAPLPSIAI